MSSRQTKPPLECLLLSSCATEKLVPKVIEWNKTLIIGPKTDGILAGALTVASGGWLIGVLLGYFQWQYWGHVLGLFVLFGIGVASLLTGKRRT